jgi:outer membrane lipoprotein-sorting protein
MNETLKKIMMTLSLGLLFSAFTGLFAQTASLEEVCKKLSSNQNTMGDFTQIKTLQTNGRKLTSTGKFIFCPLGILWQTEKPFPTSLILTKDSMTQIAANGKKSVMSGKDNQIFANISGTLSSVFSGNAEELKKNFNCKFEEGADGGWKVYLTPKDSTIASVMKSLVLAGTFEEGSAAGALLTSLEMTEMSENTILYEFANQKYPKELSADEKQNFVTD